MVKKKVITKKIKNKAPKKKVKIVKKAKVSTTKNESICLRLNSIDSEEGVFLE